MSAADDPDRDIARELRLRGDPPMVARLSRRVLVLMAGTAAVAIAAVVGWSLTDHRRAPGSEVETSSPPSPAPPEQVAALPRDYVTPPKDAPKLGPPLPGDLGRPALAARSVEGPRTEARGAEGRAASQDAVRRQAHSSPLTVATAARTAAALPAASAESAPTAPSPPATTHLLQAGTVVRAALVTGVRSDLPGAVIAQVTEDVFDSATGRWKLIPQGARLIGTYGASPGFSQDRVQLTWNRLVLPDGRSVALEAPGTDPQGVAGAAGQVDRHWRRLLGASAISTLLAVGAQAGAGLGEDPIVQALRLGAAGTANQAGQQLVGKSLEVGPTLTLEPGVPVRALVTKDLALEAWPS